MESEGHIMEIIYQDLSKLRFGVKYSDLKKGDKILTKQLGQPVSGKLLESPKQGKGLKNIVLIFTNASEVGLFDEHGSVYARDILKVKRDDNWQVVIHAPE